MLKPLLPLFTRILTVALLLTYEGILMPTLKSPHPKVPGTPAPARTYPPPTLKERATSEVVHDGVVESFNLSGNSQ